MTHAKRARHFGLGPATTAPYARSLGAPYSRVVVAAAGPYTRLISVATEWR